MEDFVIKALLAGIAIASIAGPLGSIIVWKKMAYFGDSLAHSSLFGVTLAVIFEMNLNLSILLVAVFFALLLIFLKTKTSIPIDSILGMIAHFSLALSVFLLFVISDQNIDLHSFLFGDILLVSTTDLIWIFTGTIIGLIFLIINWSNLVFYSINKDLANAYGINTFKLEVGLHLLIALIIALSIQIIGVLLVSSLLIIPAATSQLIAKSTFKMALFASIIGIIALIIGLLASVFLDTPSGPGVVVCLGIIFLLTFCFQSFNKK